SVLVSPHNVRRWLAAGFPPPTQPGVLLSLLLVCGSENTAKCRQLCTLVHTKVNGLLESVADLSMYT
ncbi:hypothetical protein GBAR_LOCUS25466, partial [Geodia barretti]